MLYVLSGPDQYRAKEWYTKKHTDSQKNEAVDFSVYDMSESGAFAQCRHFAQSGSLFGGRKMIVVRNPYTLTDKEAGLAFYSSARGSDELDIVLVVGVAKVPKELKRLEADEAQSFARLEKTALRNWIMKKAKERGIELERDVVEVLENGYNGDSWAIVNELEKLSLAFAGTVVSKEKAAPLLYGKQDETAYAFMDALWAQSGRRYPLLERALEGGVDASMIFYTLAKQSRCLFYIHAGQPKKAKLHPFVLKKMQAAARLWDFERARRFHARIADHDKHIKLGALSYDDALIDLTIKSK